MKKLALLIILAVAMTLTVTANELLIAPAPTVQTQQDPEYRALLESLSKGIIPITEELTYEDFISYMQIIDESDERILTAKFQTFIQLISYYHYSERTEYEVFELFKATVDSVDINNMEVTYKAMFSMLDKFSYYLNEQESHEMFTPTETKGIGISMVWQDATENSVEGIYIDRTAYGSPAEEAGIMPGDRLVSFNGLDTQGLGFNAVGAYINSVPDELETLSVTIERGGELIEYELERTNNVFAEHSVELYPEKKLVYLDIDSFSYETTLLDVSEAINDAWSEGYGNIIVDLRSNHGGNLEIAAQIMSKFTPEKEVLFHLGRKNDKNLLTFMSLGDGYDFDSVQVLVDSATASAAEAFADTLRRIADAKIIGSCTYGKGVAQSVFTFVDKVAVGVTTYVAYSPDGKTFNEKGVEPDVYFTYKLFENKLPDGTPSYTALNFSKAKDGAVNETVRGLEIRLEAIGFISPSKVDKTWDEATEGAVKAVQRHAGLPETGIVDYETYHAINDLVQEYLSTYYTEYTPVDHAYRFVK